MHPYGQISIIVGLVLIVVLLSFLVALPSRDVILPIINWQIVFSGPWFLGIVLAAAIYLGIDALVHSYPPTYHAGLRYTLSYWPLPGLLMLAAVPTLHSLQSPLLWIGGTALLAFLLAAILIAQYHALFPGTRLYRVSRWLLALLSYLLAFALLHSIRTSGAPVLLRVMAVGAVSSALALEVLRQKSEIRRTWGHALIVGLLVSQMAWVFTYWPLRNLMASFALFWPFYLLTGVLHQYLGGQLTRGVVAEYLLLGLFGFAALWYATL